jgi:hypothetical protein
MVNARAFTGTNPLGSPKLKLYERFGLLSTFDRPTNEMVRRLQPTLAGLYG